MYQMNDQDARDIVSEIYRKLGRSAIMLRVISALLDMCRVCGIYQSTPTLILPNRSASSSQGRQKIGRTLYCNTAYATQRNNL